MSRRRAVVFLGADTMARMLALPPGQRIVSMNADWLRDGMGFLIEGEGLDEVPEGTPPPLLDPTAYADPNLRPKLVALLERYLPKRDGDGWGALAELVDKTLSGAFDPRIEMPSPETEAL